ncbi:hypothetical protein C1I97_17330 [Streptomyces sp. NTH33]|nr:hypothetical protein C1I97_17330 [Streptomyces sp. NTH33]
MTTTVRDNPEQRRYENHGGQAPTGFSAHRITGRKNAFPHTRPLPEFSGRGPARQPVALTAREPRSGRRSAPHHRSGSTCGNSGTARWQR